jgi:hypothetical protein
MKLQNHIVTFAKNDADTLSLFASFGDYYNEYLSKRGVSDLRFSSDITFSEKEEKVNEAIVKEVAKRAGFAVEDLKENLSSPMTGWATYAVITNLVDSIMPESLERYIGLWADIQFGGYGDVFEFRKDLVGFLKVTKAGRAQRLAERQRVVKGAYRVETENHMLTMETDLYRLLLGLDSLAEMAALVVRSMAQAIANEALSALSVAVSALPTGTSGLVVSGYTQKTMMELISKVRAWSGGGVPWIVGTPAALSDIIPTAAYASLPVDSRYFALGHVTQAMGSPVFALPQLVGASAYDTALADDVIYILPSSGKPIKVGVGGEMRHSSGTFDYADLSQTVTMWKEFGVVAATGMVFGAVEL